MKSQIDDEPGDAWWTAFWEGFLRGVKESPALYFAPLILSLKAIRFGFRYLGRKVGEAVSHLASRKVAEPRSKPETGASTR